VFALLAGCAQAPTEPSAPSVPDKIAELPPLPATLVHEARCPGCLEVTVTLRADGSYLVRDQLGASEFYDFGRWRYVDGNVELAGGRDTRRYPLNGMRRAEKIEPLRGPFRMVGMYDGASFKECRTGLAWNLSATRAAEALEQQYTKQVQKPALVALDAQFEGAPEKLRVLRPATLLDSRRCPG
jgi:hypothetical protein